MSELIESTKGHLEQMIPTAKEIKVKLERDHEQYVSKIHIQLPGSVLHAQKKAPTVWEAMDFSYQAILKQLKKLKFKRIAKGKKIKMKHQLQQAPP